MAEATTSGNSPEARFVAGPISASVFVNVVKRGDGSTFQVRRTVLQKSYRDPSTGDFRNTQSLDVNDLPRAILALGKAYEFCLTALQSGNEAE